MSKSVCYADDELELKSKFIVQGGNHSFRVDSLNTTELAPSSSWKHDLVNSKSRVEYYADKKAQSVAKKIASNAKTGSSDHWNSLMEKEDRRNYKYHANDKTLLILLEEERIKYSDLEKEYSKLLNEVQALHISHKKELERQERMLGSENKSLHSALMLKTEELGAIQDTLKGQVERNVRDATSLKVENEQLILKNKKLEIDIETLAERLKLQEKVVSDLALKRKEMEKLTLEQKSQYQQILVEKSKDEKHMEKSNAERKMLENQLIMAQKALAEKEDECLAAKTQVLTLKNDQEKLDILQKKIIELKAECDQSKRRERQYLEEIEQASQRERGLAAENESLSAQVRRAVQMNELTDQKERKHSQDVENLRATVSSLKSELESTISKRNQFAEDMNEAHRELKKLNGKYSILQQELNSSRDIVDRQQREISQLHEKIGFIRDSENSQRKDYDYLLQENENLSAALKSKDDAVESLKESNNQIKQKLDSIIASKKDLKKQIKDQISADQEKIADLTRLLNEAAMKENHLIQKNENLERNLQQKNQNIESNETDLQQLQNTVLLLQSKISKQKSEFENLIKTKEESIHSVQNSFNNELSNLRSEITRLHNTLDAKSGENLELQKANNDLIRSLDDLKIKVSEIKSKFTDLNSSYLLANQQLHDKNLILEAKDREIDNLQLKQRNLNEQIKRLEEEMILNKSSNARKDGDLARLQSNVAELSRRLKSQVDMILERDIEYSSNYLASKPARLESFRDDIGRRYASNQNDTLSAKKIIGFDGL